MRALFVELPAFTRSRSDYLNDEAYRNLQTELLQAPESGDLIAGTGGLRKLRQADVNRGKDKLGVLRMIYFWWESGRQSWLFTLGCSPFTTKTRWMIFHPKSVPH
jgi:hypothetical protein